MLPILVEMPRRDGSRVEMLRRDTRKDASSVNLCLVQSCFRVLRFMYYGILIVCLLRYLVAGTSRRVS